MIESRDAGRRRRQQRFIVIGMFCRGIGPIGEQGKMKIALRAGQVMDLQALDLLFYGGQTRQQCRYRDQSAKIRGHRPPRRARAGSSRARNPRFTARLTSATQHRWPNDTHSTEQADPQPVEGRPQRETGSGGQEVSRYIGRRPFRSRRCQKLDSAAPATCARGADSQVPPRTRGGPPARRW